ncbi:targeting protein for Xklp2-like isoform X2 [Tribolium madens]|uniref:targeting protein for Xklp2-like isoform X2 n=1 Tax=Tribolium madens TaxID=41895 RepID=UPI001CF728AB|nr:targeting protein for Xklp2-like isoform X2 [Tribolium madens]
MAEAYDAINARQYFDFCQDQDDPNDSYFEKNGTENDPFEENAIRNGEVFEQELSDAESDHFYSPMENPALNNSTVYLKCRLRRSLSMGNLKVDKVPNQNGLERAMDELCLNDHPPPRPNSTCSLNSRKTVSRDHINRLAQPKRYTSHDNLSHNSSMTLAEAVNKFQSGTPKRFRSKPNNKKLALTKPHTPKFLTNTRVRPVTALSKQEQEEREFEEAKKFKIKANPVNKKVLRGPLKPPVDKKPATVVEPFHLTEARKKSEEEPDTTAPVFKAQPVPKSLHNPFKVQPKGQAPTKPESPNFCKKAPKAKPTVAKPEEAPKVVFKPTNTQVVPFSFEQRDKQLMKKKEEFISKVLEEEKKAREFHARPVPRTILRSRNNSQDNISDPGSKSFKRSTEELNIGSFKARPAKVLTMKPFEPKKCENHGIVVEEFQFSTNERLEKRREFEEALKAKEAAKEAKQRQAEELLRRREEEEVARLRKQAELKAQPIKKYKEVTVKPAKKCTNPVSPKFHTRDRNKENIH